MSTGAWMMLLIFVVLPFVTAPLVVWFVSSRSPSVPMEHRTDWLLAVGESGRGVVLSVRTHGTSFIDFRPMTSVRLEVTPADGGAPFELVATQSIPRAIVGGIDEGMEFDVRYSPDRAACAIVFPVGI